jgi:ABC-2 type transport system permease protein
VRRLARTYAALVRVGFAEALAYRAEMIVWMLTTTMPLVSLALWSAVAAEAPVGRFGPADFVAYFLAALVVRQLTSSWLVWQLNQEIRQGALSQRLLRPIHPLLHYSAENLAALPLRAALAVPVAAVAIVVVGGSHFARDPVVLAVVAASLFGAWLINFLTMALVGSLAFYTESSTSAFEIWLSTSMLLSGYLVPLELFPGWVRAATAVLPFRYTLGFPVEALTGKLDRAHALADLGLQWVWVALLGALALAAWRAGVKRFSAYGG